MAKFNAATANLRSLRTLISDEIPISGLFALVISHFDLFAHETLEGVRIRKKAKRTIRNFSRAENLVTM